MGLKDGARAGGREVGVLDFVGPDGGQVRLQVGQFAVNLDGEGCVGVGCGVNEMERAELLVDEAAGTGLEGFEVEALVGLDLGDFFGAGVVAEERDGAVAVGEEVDGVADPDGVGVVGVVARDFDQVESLEIHDPDGRGLSADIALPGRLPSGDGLIGERLAVGREGACVACGQGQRLRHAGAVGVDEEELEEVAIAERAAGAMRTFLPSGDQPTTRCLPGAR